MVREICDSYEFNGHHGEINQRYVTFAYNTNNEQDMKYIQEINNILNRQNLCNNCVNYYMDGYFCGYSPASCKVYGCLEIPSNPHYDGDGSKCEYYKRLEN